MFASCYNYAPFYTQVIPASAREAIYVLDGLLYHALTLMPREHYTDSHGYTDIVFALTYLLGFRLAPRMAKFPDLTLWYGKGYDVEFQELFHGRITQKSIASQWEAVQRISATIQNGRTRASQIIRKVSAFNRNHLFLKAYETWDDWSEPAISLRLQETKNIAKEFYKVLTRASQETLWQRSCATRDRVSFGKKILI